MPNWKKVITSGSAAVLSDLTLSGVTQPEIKFNGTSDAGVDFAIRATPEGLDFYEPEDGNKIHMQIIDDGGVDAKYGLKINGTSVLSQARALSNVTGNISMFTNNSGYVTTSGNTIIGTDSDITTSGATVVNNIYMTDGVITSHTTRTLTLANLGYTGATDANKITNNNQLSNGAGYITSFTNTVDMGSGFIVANNGGTSQFTIVEDNALRFAGTGATTVSFNSTTKKVTIDSTNTQYSVGDGGLTQKNFTTTLKSKLDGIAASANNYSHPTFNGDDINVDTGALTGATVISDLDFNVTTDTNGHVTDANGSVGTRTLTLSNLGFTGATNANYITNNNQLSNGAGYTTNVGDITGVIAGTGLSGGSTSGTATLNSVYLPAVDDRDMKPNTSGVGSSVKGVKPFFTSLGGMTGTANTDYQDALVLDTYSDSSGGNANCLIFDKNAFIIKHYNAASTATSWGTPKTIAYTSDIITNNNQISNGAGYVTTSGNTIIGTDSDINTSGAVVVDQLNMTDGVIQSHSTRTLTLANLGYTGATNANYITNNNQLSNGAGYITSFTNTVDMGDGFKVQDSDGTQITITENKYIKFIEGTGIDVNFTDTSTGNSTDPFDITITNTAPAGASHLNSNTTKSQVGLGNVANESRATILGGNLTGTINSVAVATVTAGAAAGATANQDSTSTIRSGTTKANVGLSNVTNESKATMFSSAALTGNPTAPTQAANNNSTRIATTAYVQTEITDLIGGAPGALDTLNELAAAIDDDASFASSVTTSLGTKLPKSGGTMSGAINMNNSNITGVNNLAFADPGPSEGLSWSGGNMKLYESPNDLTTNTAGNLQIVYGTTRRLTVDNTGINVNGNATLSGFVLDGNTITGVDDSGEFTDNDAHIMTSAGVDDRISSRISGLTSNAGTMTGITINTATGLDGAGTLSGTGGTINLSLDLSELTDMTGGIDTGVDELILLDNGAERRKRFSEIFGSNAYNSTTIPSAANNATITISAGNALTTGGNFTTNQGSNETITIHHADTSTQASVDNSGNTVIQDVTLDGYGHVTGLVSKALSIPTVNNATLTLSTSAGLDGSTTFTSNQSSATTFNVSLDLSELTDMTTAVDGAVDEIILLDNGAERRKRFAEIGLSTFSNDAGFTSHAAANNATITIAAGNALTTGGNFTTNQSSNETITIHHGDTSTQASSNNSNGTVIQDVTLDTYGHVTGLGTYNLDGRYFTETESDARFLAISAKAADSNLLDGLDLHTGRNNVANRVVRTDGSGYLNTGWINTTSGNTTSTITDVYVNTNDGYIRKATKAEFQSQMGIQNVVSNTDVDTGTETVASAPISSYSGYFFDYVVSNGGNFRAGTVTAVEYDGNVEFTETSTNDIGDTSDLTLYCDGANGSDMKLRATATSDNWSVKVKMRLI